jgi:hypothetical protein
MRGNTDGASPVAQNRDVWAVEPALGGGEVPAQRKPHSEDLEEVVRYANRPKPFGFTAASERLPASKSKNAKYAANASKLVFCSRHALNVSALIVRADSPPRPRFSIQTSRSGSRNGSGRNSTA